MRKLIIFLFLLPVAAALKAQDDKAIKAAVEKSKYQYAFLYVNIKLDTMFIHYDSGEDVPVGRMTFTNLIKGVGSSYRKVTEGFDRYTNAFKYLEAEGYDFIGTGNYLYGEFNVPYYMFRRKKAE